MHGERLVKSMCGDNSMNTRAGKGFLWQPTLMTIQTSTSAKPQHIEANSTGQGHLYTKHWWPLGTHRAGARHRHSIRRIQTGTTRTQNTTCPQLPAQEEHKRSLKHFTAGVPGPLHHSNRCWAHYVFTNILVLGCQVDGLKSSAPLSAWADFLDTHLLVSKTVRLWECEQNLLCFSFYCK